MKMKKVKVITIAAILMMIAGINKINATDIYVEENGFAGAYTTIGAACNAAHNGDRILVVPRAFNSHYYETSTINLPYHCEMLSAVPGQRFIVYCQNVNFNMGTGSMISMAAIYFISPPNTNSIGYNQGDSIGIINCLIDNGSMYGGFGVHFDNDTIYGGNVYFIGGRISGCYVAGRLVFTLPRLLYIYTGIYDTLFVVGNSITNGIYDAANSAISSYVYIANNYISSSGIKLYYLIGGSGMNTIINNTIFNSGISLLSSNVIVNLNISNNLLFIYPAIGSYTAISLFNTPPSAISKISYNFVNYNNSSSNYTFASGFTNDGTNVITSNTEIDAQGQLIPGSDAINGGDPSGYYLNLDLTRNSAGCYGGSYSMSNFNTPGIGNPRVLFMTAPREVFSTQPVGISADGVAK